MRSDESAKGDVARPWARWAAAAFWAALVMATLAAAARKPFPFRGGDEQGHFSYVVDLVRTGAWWPDLAVMPLYGLDGAPTATANFINHPPLFYWTMEPAYLALTTIGADPSWLRAVTLPFSFAAFALIALVLLRMRIGALGFAAALAAMLLLHVPTFAMFFNNDQFALLGGALACYGAARRLEDRTDGPALALVLAGVALCSVKLTALMLVGGFCALALASDRGWAIDRRGLAWLAAIGVAASAPYAVLLAQYGSPTPETPGQIALLHAFIAEFRWESIPRMSPIDYLLSTPMMFGFQLDLGNAGFFVLAVLFLGPFVAFRRTVSEEERVAAAIARAALIATLAMLVIHIGFAHRRYEAFGWLGDLYPRYYFPLLGAYALGFALFAKRLRVKASVLWRRVVSAIRPQISASRPG